MTRGYKSTTASNDKSKEAQTGPYLPIMGDINLARQRALRFTSLSPLLSARGIIFQDSCK